MKTEGLISTIDTTLQVVESEELKRAVASELLVPDPRPEDDDEKEDNV